MVWVFIGLFLLIFPSIFDTHYFELSEGATLHPSSMFGYHYILHEIDTRTQHKLYFKAVRTYPEFMVLWSDSFYT